jgi:hypothetical protein
MRFVHQRGGGFVNLDLVAELREMYTGKSESPAYKCLSDAGEELGEVDRDEIFWAIVPVIPNHASARLIEFYFWDGKGGETQQVHAEYYTIVGWRILDASDSTATADPIVCETLTDDTVKCIEEQDPNGDIRWRFPGDVTCNAFSDAEEHARDRLLQIQQLQHRREQREQAQP